jgi:hypothetical protein
MHLSGCGETCASRCDGKGYGDGGFQDMHRRPPPPPHRTNAATWPPRQRAAIDSFSRWSPRCGDSSDEPHGRKKVLRCSTDLSCCVGLSRRAVSRAASCAAAASASAAPKPAHPARCGAGGVIYSAGGFAGGDAGCAASGMAAGSCRWRGR